MTFERMDNEGGKTMDNPNWHMLALRAGSLEPATIERLVADRPCGAAVDHAAADLPAGQAARAALVATKVPAVVTEACRDDPATG